LKKNMESYACNFARDAYDRVRARNNNGGEKRPRTRMARSKKEKDKHKKRREYETSRRVFKSRTVLSNQVPEGGKIVLRLRGNVCRGKTMPGVDGSSTFSRHSVKGRITPLNIADLHL